jgi:hypothetical protein
MAPVWYRPVGTLLIRRRRPLGEPNALVATAWDFASTIDGTRGAGRVCLALEALGVPIIKVTQAVVDADVAAGELDGFKLDRPFDTVVLGSHLVNLPDAGLRRAFLRAAARHAAANGPVLVEHHPLEEAAVVGHLVHEPSAALGVGQ